MPKLEEAHRIPCKLQVDKVKQLQERISTPLFPVLIADPNDVEFKYHATGGEVGVYLQGEFVCYISRRERASITDDTRSPHEKEDDYPMPLPRL